MSLNTSQIAQSLAKGGIATLVSSTGAQIVRVLAILVIARLIPPHEYGLFVMISSALGIATVLRDMGLSAATIQSPDITQRQHATLFWINVGLGLFLSLTVAIASPWIARRLGAPDAYGYIIAFAPVFLLGGLGTQHKALMTRQLAFGSLAKMTFWSAVASQALAVTLAASGAGIWALIVGACTAEAVITLWSLRAAAWKPLPVLALREVRPLLSFGGYLAAFGILGYLGANLHQLLIGIYCGTADAGYFNRAIVLLALPISLIMMPLGEVVTAALSRLQSEPAVFAHYYLKSATLINLVTAPVAVLCIVIAPALVRLLLGPNWDESGVLLRLMGFSLLVQPIMFTTGWVYRALGRARGVFWWGNVAWSFILLMYVLGLQWGAEGVALSHSVALMILFWPCLYYAFRGTSMTSGQLLRRCFPAAGAATLAGLATFAITTTLHAYAPLWQVLVASAFYFCVYLLCLIMLGDGPLLKNLLGQVKVWISHRQSPHTSDSR